MKRNHKHAEILRWVADGEDIECSHLDYPWRSVTGNEVLQRLLNDGENHPENRFRIKPKMIKVNGHEFPEPMRVAPAVKSLIWAVDIAQQKAVYEADFLETPYDLMLLKRGLMHCNRDAAEAHAMALTSLTEVKE